MFVIQFNMCGCGVSFKFIFFYTQFFEFSICRQIYFIDWFNISGYLRSRAIAMFQF